MPKHSKPRAGSKQFWPRKRAKRIYPDVAFNNEFINKQDVKPLLFAGYKVGMTHVQYIDTNSKSPTYNQTVTKPVTILETPPVFVCGIRFYKKGQRGLNSIGEKWATKLPKNLSKKIGKHNPKNKEVKKEDVYDLRLVVTTSPEKSNMEKKKPEMFEVNVGGSDVDKKMEYAESVLGKEVNINDIFEEGELIDVTAVTRGYGFTGPVKRFGISIQTRKDEQHHRHAGSKGQERPGKMRWQVPMPGQYGFFKRTESCKRILKINEDPKKLIPKGGFVKYGLVNENTVMLEGSIPGPRKRLIMLRKSLRAKNKPKPVELKYISTESKQGV